MFLTDIFLHMFPSFPLRAQLVDDLMAFAEWTEGVDYSLALTLYEYLAAETEFVPWYAANIHLRRLGDELLFSDALTVKLD